MKLFVVSLMFVALPVAALPVSAQPVAQEWYKVTVTPGLDGMSGLARLEDDRYVTCSQGVLREFAVDSLALIPVGGGEVVGLDDLEAICAVPGQPGHYLVAAGDQVKEVVRDPEGDYTLGKLAFRLPSDSGSADFEGFDVFDLEGHTIAVWGDRATGRIFYATFDGSKEQPLGAHSSLLYKSPLVLSHDENLLCQISDLKVRANGDLLVVSNTLKNSVEDGLQPQRSAVALAGRFVVTDGKPELQMAQTPRAYLMEQTEHMIEGLEFAGDTLILVTQDDGASSFTTLRLED